MSTSKQELNKKVEPDKKGERMIRVTKRLHKELRVEAFLQNMPIHELLDRLFFDDQGNCWVRLSRKELIIKNNANAKS